MLDLMFNQFSIEMIKQQMVTRRADIRLLRNQYEARAIASEQNSLNQPGR